MEERPSYQEYEKAVAEARKMNPNWRLGQAYFNTLYFGGYHPQLADRVRGTPIDPFHDDSKIMDFIMFVQDNWDS